MISPERREELMCHVFQLKLRNGDVINGARLAGALSKFPTLHYTDQKTGLGFKQEVSWETLDKLANENRPLPI